MKAHPIDCLTPLSNEDQRQWMVEHIPHRIRAVLPGIPMAGDWNVGGIGAVAGRELAVRCYGNSGWEGRMTALRWLILLLGVAAKGNNYQPCRPNVLDPDKDVFLNRIAGGSLMPLDHPDIQMLARIWAGCSKAMSHPTNRTEHPAVKEPQQAGALTAIIQYLQNSIYAHHGKRIQDFVLSMKTERELLLEWEAPTRAKPQS